MGSFIAARSTGRHEMGMYRARRETGRTLRHASVLLIIIWASGAQAVDSEYSRASLKSIKGLHILVEDLTPQTRQMGFSKEKILRDVEGKLRLAGIRSLSQDQYLRVKGQPYLYVALSALHNPSADNLIVYYIEIQLVQNVLLERDPKTLVDAPTWSISKIGATHRIRHVRNELEGFMDLFLTAYLSVNPAELPEES